MKFTVTTEVDPASDTHCGSCPQIRSGKDHDHCRLFDDAVLVFDSGHWRTDKCVIAGQRAELALLRTSKATPPTGSGSFPSDSDIRAHRFWRRHRAGGQSYIVELAFLDGDLVDDSGDGPPLVLRSAQGKEAASFPQYLADRWTWEKPPASDLLDLRALEIGTLLELKRDVPTLSLRAGDRLRISGIGWDGPRPVPEKVNMIRAHIEGAEGPVILPAAHWQLPAVVIEKAKPALLDLRTLLRGTVVEMTADALGGMGGLVVKGMRVKVDEAREDVVHVTWGGAETQWSRWLPFMQPARVVKHACPRCDEGMREIELTEDVRWVDETAKSGTRFEAKSVSPTSAQLFTGRIVGALLYRFVRADVPPPSEWCDGNGVK